ncbi:polypeptide N-acetylgalactosaminyltransferase 10-like isoform X2 [Apostichopus japonicus]|uniref:polypeptide N-acetylgalactosaminyltransferase 10-like isoform X2 n=1 Tax=Stichopus japonicus TaxID=307972 RepID=UPI003AB66F9E
MRFRKRYIAKSLAAFSIIFFIGIVIMRSDVRSSDSEGGSDLRGGKALVGLLKDNQVRPDQQGDSGREQKLEVKKSIRDEVDRNKEVEDGGKSDDEEMLVRIDWHDWDKINQYKMRQGPGEQGRKVELDAELKKTHREDVKANGFNERISNLVSLDRAVPDIRHPGCQTIKYLKDLPTASIVIPFHNEALSALKRTVHSVFNMSPPQLIKEIVLVDDFSNREYLKKELDDYMEQFPKVRILRNEMREGLIRTRLNGAKVAVGDVIIFLDSHCEANVNWLPPLLERIALNRKRIACPMIDVISNEDFHYETQAGDVMRGAFDWELYYKRIPINQAERNRRSKATDPVRSPIMAGGLFAIDRKYFMEELGGYDDGLEIWGGEQYDLSFKIWMCGGEMEEVPCSRVGHIYRLFMSYSVPGGGNVIGKNLQRVVEVWMDEWKEHFYKRKPYLRGNNFGDISKQLALRDRLKCKNFTWFMTEVAPDILEYYPAVEPEPRTMGEVKSVSTGKCLTKETGVFLKPCTKASNQIFTITWHDDMREKELATKDCIDFSNYQKGKKPSPYRCHHGGGNQLWVYHPKTLHVYHPVSAMCLDIFDEKIGMNHCDKDAKSQKWKWPIKDEKKVAELAAKHPIKYIRP